MGTRSDQDALESRLLAVARGHIELDRESGGLMVMLSESDLERLAEGIRKAAEDTKYVLFDPQCGRLVVPGRRSATAWPPEWAMPVRVIREVAGGTRPRDVPEELREDLIAGIARRLSRRPTPPLSAELELPFDAPPGFVLPPVLPVGRRTAKRFGRLNEALKKKRPESRRLAALELVGWTNDPGAAAALRDRLDHDVDEMVRGISALGLALSNAISLAEIVTVARSYVGGSRGAGSMSHPLASGRENIGDIDEEGLAYLLLAGAVAGIREPHDRRLAELWADVWPIVQRPLEQPRWEALARIYGAGLVDAP